MNLKGTEAVTVAQINGRTGWASYHIWLKSTRTSVPFFVDNF